MKAAIVTAVFLVGFVAIIHHGSACRLKLNTVQQEGRYTIILLFYIDVWLCCQKDVQCWVTTLRLLP